MDLATLKFLKGISDIFPINLIIFSLILNDIQILQMTVKNIISQGI